VQFIHSGVSPRFVSFCKTKKADTKEFALFLFERVSLLKNFEVLVI